MLRFLLPFPCAEDEVNAAVHWGEGDVDDSFLVGGDELGGEAVSSGGFSGDDEEELYLTLSFKLSIF